MIRIGARNSPLARAQADAVAAALGAYGVRTEFVPIRTQGDVDRRDLTQIGGTGVFTGAVRDALLDGSIDVGVHSCKDLPTAAVEGLEVIAYPTREDSHDVLIGLRLAELDPSAGPVRIGTGAPRRVVQLEQLAAARGLDLRIEPVRGNVDTRLDLVRSGKIDAVVLAAAGVLLIADVRWSGSPAGVLWALAAAAMWAAYVLLGKRVARGGNGIDEMAVGFTTAAVLLSPLLLTGGTAGLAPLAEPAVLGLAVGLGVLSSVIPYVLDQVVLRRVGQARFAVLLALLPVTATIVGFVVLGQLPGALEIGGIAAVIAAVALRSRDGDEPPPEAGPASSRSVTDDHPAHGRHGAV